jgi:pimeloyl-ACP methyl ester carboxylesterase
MVTAEQITRPDGARLHVEMSGQPSNPTLVLLQGQASSLNWWAELRGRFADRFRIITMDYRGTGRTVDPGGELSTELLGNDIVAVLDALGVASAHLYGTSMGGRVAQMAAAAHPRRIASLVLAATSPGGAQAIEPSIAVRRELASPEPSVRRAALVRLFYTPAWGIDASRSRLLGDPTMSATNRQRHVRLSARHTAWNLLPWIDCPALVMHGTHDALTPATNASLLVKRLPNARLYLHQGGRHGFFDEFADDVDEVLDAFWSSSAV